MYMVILTLEQAVEFRKKARENGKKVVFTNGCFDIIHRGHIEYLSQAAKLGDVLIVGINTDASVRRIKEKGRPIICEEDRAVIIASLRYVDAVCLFDVDTPSELIKSVRPDVLVKGSEYSIEEIVGHEQVLADGGKVISIPMVPGKSSTDLIKKIKELPD